jgi:hypothetical protein
MQQLATFWAAISVQGKSDLQMLFPNRQLTPGLNHYPPMLKVGSDTTQNLQLHGNPTLQRNFAKGNQDQVVEGAPFSRRHFQA